MGIVSDEIKALKPTCFGAAEVRNIGGRFYVYPFTSKYDKITKKRHKVTLRSPEDFTFFPFLFIIITH